MPTWSLLAIHPRFTTPQAQGQIDGTAVCLFLALSYSLPRFLQFPFSAFISGDSPNVLPFKTIEDLLEISVLRNVTPCRFVYKCRRFRRQPSSPYQGPSKYFIYPPTFTASHLAYWYSQPWEKPDNTWMCRWLHFSLQRLTADILSNIFPII